MERNKNPKLLRRTSAPLKRADAPIHIDSLEVYVTFRQTPSLRLKTIAMFMGSVKVLIYTYNPSDIKPFTIQNYLPEFNVFIGSYKTEKECKAVCLRVAKLFCDKLESL